jgi:DNA/RNA endonuclease YhcR with UshA esterase domain
MKFKYLLILLSVGSLALLYVLSLFSQPTIISLTMLSSYDGKQVSTTGVVTDYRTTNYGSQIITIKDQHQNNTSEITVYLEGNAQVEYGDVITVTGTVQQYNNQWELAVDNPRFITIIKKWANTTCPLWQLGQYPERYLNTNVNVVGIIEKTYPSYFILTDAEGKYSLKVYYSSSTSLNLSSGDTVSVGARLLYEPENLCYALQVSEPNHYVHIQEE